MCVCVYVCVCVCVNVCVCLCVCVLMCVCVGGWGGAVGLERGEARGEGSQVFMRVSMRGGRRVCVDLEEEAGCVSVIFTVPSPFKCL
jgi:hypothetical protein